MEKLSWARSRKVQQILEKVFWKNKKAKKPFAVIRAISDTAETRLPEWTDEIVSTAGGTDGIRLLKNLALHPGDIGKLLSLGRGSTKALKILRRVASELGPEMAFR